MTMSSEFKFHCVHCGQRVAASPDLIGTVVSCPACGEALTIPDLSADQLTPVEDDSMEAPSEGPSHHYAFAHVILPAYLWNQFPFLGVLANPENQDYLHQIWNSVPDCLDVTSLRSADGLGYTAHWIGGEHLVYVIQTPVPEKATEAYVVVITTSPAIRYFTFEKGELANGLDTVYFCEWFADDSRRNYGPIERNPNESFLVVVCDHLGLPRMVEEPTRNQLLGLEKSGQPKTLHLDLTGQLDAADQKAVDKLESEAAKAAKKPQTLERAADLYREILMLRVSRQGLNHSDATMPYSELVEVLQGLEDFDEMESTCREWWQICRRHRAPGHSETLLAINFLAQALLLLGRQNEAKRLQAYRLHLAKSMRGPDSIQASTAEFEHTLFNALAAAAGSKREITRKERRSAPTSSKPLFGGMTEKQRSHFRNLVSVAMADGRIDEKEREMLGQLGQRLDLTDDEIASILEQPESGRFLVPETQKLRLRQLIECVMMMLADGCIDDAEMLLCRQLASRLGFKADQVVPRLIELIVAQGGDGGINLDGLLDEFECR